MTSFRELLNQPLGVVFMDEVNGKERWQILTGEVVPGTDGLAIRFPPQARSTFHLDPEWEERLRLVPDYLRGKCTADFMIYVKVRCLPPDADLNDYSATGINLNAEEE